MTSLPSRSPLEQAAHSGDLATLSQLLPSPGQFEEVSNRGSLSALDELLSSLSTGAPVSSWVSRTWKKVRLWFTPDARRSLLAARYWEFRLDSQKALFAAIWAGHEDVVRLLVPFGTSGRHPPPSWGGAVKGAHAEVALGLIPESIIKNEGMLLEQAAKSGNMEMLRLLLTRTSFPYGTSALWWAAQNSNAEMVRMLLPVSDQKASRSLALQLAASSGDEEAVSLLLPSPESSTALWVAANSGHVAVVRLLVPFSNIEVAMKLAIDNASGIAMDLLFPHAPLGMVRDALTKMRSSQAPQARAYLAAHDRAERLSDTVPTPHTSAAPRRTGRRMRL